LSFVFGIWGSLFGMLYVRPRSGIGFHPRGTSPRFFWLRHHYAGFFFVFWWITFSCWAPCRSALGVENAPPGSRSFGPPTVSANDPVAELFFFPFSNGAAGINPSPFGAADYFLIFNLLRRPPPFAAMPGFFPVRYSTPCILSPSPVFDASSSVFFLK